MFKITQKKGFHMTFPNGWTVSVQFGPGNYCDNRDNYLKFAHNQLSMDRAYEEAGREGSTTAEIAAWSTDHRWYRWADIDDTVRGNQTATEVLAFMNLIANLPTEVSHEG